MRTTASEESTGGPRSTVEQPESRAPSDPSDGAPSLALLLAAALWGCSFTWAKTGGAGVNAGAGLAPGSPLGPVLFLGWRFLAAALLWFVLSPGARRGWSRQSLGRGVVLGLLLWFPMMLQMLGLDRTSEAVSAFLTSLAVVFVPLVMTFVLRKPPLAVMWLAVAMAAAGIWMMTGAAPTGFGVGEFLGLSCAVVFSVHIIVLNEVMRRESVARMTLAQFAVVGVGALAVCPFLEGGSLGFHPASAWSILVSGDAGLRPTLDGILASPSVWLNMALVIAVSTIGAFGLMFAFQPRVSPTRAALVYLSEPVFAALFALVVAGRGLAPVATAGAALILVANAFAEIAGRWWVRGARGPALARRGHDVRDAPDGG